MSELKSALARLAGRLAPDLRFRQQAYSLEGEDLILKRIFGDRSGGRYVDVGAHHPFRYSNTYLFYKRQWQGINIEPMAGSKAIFDRYRPRDINLQLAVSTQSQPLRYRVFEDTALNTFSTERADQLVGRHEVIAEYDIETRPLSVILGDHLDPGATIDFMTIDVEGWDLDVLRSNDWERYRPTYVVVESGPIDDAGVDETPLGTFMRGVNYRFFAKTCYTYFFQDRRSS